MCSKSAPPGFPFHTDTPHSQSLTTKNFSCVPLPAATWAQTVLYRYALFALYVSPGVSTLLYSTVSYSNLAEEISWASEVSNFGCRNKISRFIRSRPMQKITNNTYNNIFELYNFKYVSVRSSKPHVGFLVDFLQKVATFWKKSIGLSCEFTYVVRSPTVRSINCGG